MRLSVCPSRYLISLQSLDIQHGASTALGFLIARYINQQQITHAITDDVVIEDIEMQDESTEPNQPSNNLTAVVTKLGKVRPKML